jgi:hypothetical protein
MSLHQDETKTTFRLIDEVDTVLIKSGYNDTNRTLLSSTTPSWTNSYAEGYGVFKVVLIFEGDWDQYLGLWADDEQSQARQCSFLAVEV